MMECAKLSNQVSLFPYWNYNIHLKYLIMKLPLFILSLLLYSAAYPQTLAQRTEKTAIGSLETEQTNGIVGEWEQQYTCFDKNGNYKLEAAEKKPSGTKLGFNWFLFKADGSCLRDKDIKFTGTYEIQEKNGNKKLVIHGGDNLRYTIYELTDKELILGADGAFMVFKRK
jgi:hypothetical protein